MNKNIVGALGAALLAIGAAGVALGDDDDGERGGAPRNRALAPVVNETYRTECGGCHFAYQPGLLPAQDWERLMGSLDRISGTTRRWTRRLPRICSTT